MADLLEAHESFAPRGSRKCAPSSLRAGAGTGLTLASSMSISSPFGHFFVILFFFFDFFPPPKSSSEGAAWLLGAMRTCESSSSSCDMHAIRKPRERDSG